MPLRVLPSVSCLSQHSAHNPSIPGDPPQAQVRCKRRFLGGNPIGVFCCTWTLTRACSLMIALSDASQNASSKSLPYYFLFLLYFHFLGTIQFLVSSMEPHQQMCYKRIEGCRKVLMRKCIIEEQKARVSSHVASLPGLVRMRVYFVKVWRDCVRQLAHTISPYFHMISTA